MKSKVMGVETLLPIKLMSEVPHSCDSVSSPKMAKLEGILQSTGCRYEDVNKTLLQLSIFAPRLK
jgi:hypothetical protein